MAPHPRADGAATASTPGSISTFDRGDMKHQSLPAHHTGGNREVDWAWGSHSNRAVICSVVAIVALLASFVAGAPTTQPSKSSAGTRQQYQSFALTHQGDAAHGKSLFEDEQRLACTKCHTTDGKAAKAGPDL